MSYFLLLLCSENLRLFYFLGKAIFIVSLVVVLLATFLMISAVPPNTILRQYPIGLKLRLFLSFAEYPANEVAAGHIAAFRKLRRRLALWGLALYSATILRIVYVDVLTPRVLSMIATNRCGK